MMKNDVGIPSGTVMRRERPRPIDLEELAGLVCLDLDEAIENPAFPRFLVICRRRHREVVNDAVVRTLVDVVGVVAQAVDTEGQPLRALTSIEILNLEIPLGSIDGLVDQLD